MLETSGLTRRFGDRTAVESLTLTVRQGEIVSLLGPNGAGKTTTFRMLAALLPPTDGRIAIGGTPLTPATADTLRARVGLLTEAPGLWERLSVRRNLRTYARLYGVADEARRVDDVMHTVGIADRADERAGALSKGLKQRVALARTIVHDPAVVLLDEPTSGLDPASARQVRDVIAGLRAEGRAVLVSTHNLAEAEALSDRIAVLNTTLLAVDSPQRLRGRWRAGRELALEVDGDADVWRQQASVAGSTVERTEGGTLLLHVDDDSVVPDVVASLVCAGARIRRVVPRDASLEDVYLALVSHDASSGSRAGCRPDPEPSRAEGMPPRQPRRTRLQPSIQVRSGVRRGAWRRVAAVVRKDIEEVRQQPGLVLPAAAMCVALTAPAFLAVAVVPWATGESLAETDFAAAAAAATRLQPALTAFGPEAQVQAFVLQQFLLFGLLVPVLGSLALASQSLIGEKQTRSLEPLLATPIGTGELLLAKIVTPCLLAMALTVGTFLIYAGGAWLWTEPGVWRVLVWPRTLMLFGLMGPLISLTALMLGAIVSSRVNDARTAQQLGGFLVLPVVVLFLAQLTGEFLAGSTALGLAAAATLIADVVLFRMGIRVFRRETILLRWK